MANEKISQLPTVTNSAVGASSIIPLVDSVDSTTKSIALSQLDLRYAALGTQAANKVLAGPTSGSASTPSYRSLVQADIPSGQGNTPGVLFDFAGTSAPTGSLACDGSAVSRTTYANLFTAIGTTWGAGNGTTTFNVPDLRGITTRGNGSHGTLTYSAGGAVAGPSVGAYFNDQVQGHNHNTTQTKRNSSGSVSDFGFFANGDNTGGPNSTMPVGDPVTDGTNGTPRYGLETRGFAGGVLKCVWY